MVMDIFTINQHPNRFFEDSAAIERTLHLMVAVPGRMLFVLHPWNDPLPLKRCWCLYEVYTCLNNGGQLAVGLSEKDSSQFYDALQVTSQKNAMRNMVTSLDARNATATMLSDVDMIFGKIERDVGFGAFNEFLHNALLSWLRKEAFRRFSYNFGHGDDTTDPLKDFDGYGDFDVEIDEFDDGDFEVEIVHAQPAQKLQTAHILSEAALAKLIRMPKRPSAAGVAEAVTTTAADACSAAIGVSNSVVETLSNRNSLVLDVARSWPPPQTKPPDTSPTSLW
jgi:hypothetical protein